MRNEKVRLLCEAALCVAMSVVLSYVKLDVGPSGGSINATMIPLILFAIRWGWGWGVAAGLVFGTLKYFLGEGFVISWIEAEGRPGLAGRSHRLRRPVCDPLSQRHHRVRRVDAGGIFRDDHDLPVFLLRAL